MYTPSTEKNSQTSLHRPLDHASLYPQEEEHFAPHSQLDSFLNSGPMPRLNNVSLLE